MGAGVPSLSRKGHETRPQDTMLADGGLNTDVNETCQ